MECTDLISMTFSDAVYPSKDPFTFFYCPEGMEYPDLFLMTFSDHVNSRKDPFITSLIWLADHSHFTIYAVNPPVNAAVLIQKHANFLWPLLEGGAYDTAKRGD